MSRRNIEALRRAIEDDTQFGQRDAEVDALLRLDRLAPTLASEVPPLDADRLWMRLAPLLAPRTPVRRHSGLNRLARIARHRGALPFHGMALAGRPGRAVAVLVTLLLVAVLAFVSTTNSASAQFLHDVNTVARISAVSVERRAIPPAQVVTLEQTAVRLSSTLKAKPTLLDSLTVAEIERAKATLESAHTVLATTDAADAGAATRIAAHLDGVIDSLAEELVERVGPPPRSMDVSTPEPAPVPSTIETSAAPASATPTLVSPSVEVDGPLIASREAPREPAPEAPIAVATATATATPTATATATPTTTPVDPIAPTPAPDTGSPAPPAPAPEPAPAPPPASGGGGGRGG